MPFDPSIGIARTLDQLASVDGHVSLVRRKREGYSLTIAEPRWIRTFDDRTLSGVMTQAFNYVEQLNEQQQPF